MKCSFIYFLYVVFMAFKEILVQLIFFENKYVHAYYLLWTKAKLKEFLFERLKC